MSVRNKRFELRLSVHERERWEAAATAKGLDLATWVRVACDKMAELGEHLEPASHSTVVEAPRSSSTITVTTRNLTKPSKRPRTTMCEHRLPPGAFCKACD